MCLLQPPEEQKEGEEGEGAAAEEEVIYKYIPPEPKEWVSQGSEKEIAEENVVETRGKVRSHGVRPLCSHPIVPCPIVPPLGLWVVSDMGQGHNGMGSQ